MSQPWKLLPFAAIVAALGALLLAPGGAVRPDVASAAFDCTNQQPLTIQIRDLDDGNQLVGAAGISVSVSPNPLSADGGGTLVYVDNGNNDDSNTVGVIRENTACTTTDGSLYSFSIVAFPSAFSCDVIIGGTGSPVQQAHTSANTIVELYVGNCDYAATATPTGTVTGTPGPAATVTTSASPQTIGCSGTSIVTIQVRDAAGQPVPAGTAITISTTLGSVSPSAGQTTDASGHAFVFLTAGANEGGTATVTATSGNAEGSTTVTINCGAQATPTSPPAPTATTAPPPTTSPGVISPPATGSAGLAAGTSGSLSLAAVMAVAMVAVLSTGALALARVRG